MEQYELAECDRKLIETALEAIRQNYDDGVYNHTAGCALCLPGQPAGNPE